MLNAADRDKLEMRRIAIENELEQLAAMVDEDDLAADCADALRIELEQISKVLYAEDANRQRAQGRSEQD